MINMATSGRTAARPLGYEDNERVAAANRMVSRVCLLALLAAAKGMLWLIEQPRGSMMQSHPRMQMLLRVGRVYRAHVCMRAFGASSQKPTWIYGNRDFIGELNHYTLPESRRSTRTVQMTRSWVDKDGKNCWEGGKDLKASQAYPAAFGKAVRAVWSSRRKMLQKEAEEMKKSAAVAGIEEAMKKCIHDSWADADLQSVINYLLGSL